MGMPPFFISVNEERTIIMNTTPLAPSSAVCGKKMNCASPRHKRRHGDREQERAAAVFLLERRTDEQQKEHVAHIVAVARVTEDVREQAQIRQGIGERRAVDAEKPRGRRAARDHPRAGAPAGSAAQSTAPRAS